MKAIETLTTSQTKSVLTTMALISGNNLEKLSDQLTVWIDRSLMALGERYKRWIHGLSFALGLLIAVGFNINTVSVVQRLYADKDLRDTIASEAQALSQKVSPEVFERCSKSSDELKTSAECAPLMSLTSAIAQRAPTVAKLPIGWAGGKPFAEEDVPGGGRSSSWFVRVVGWILTALAVSLGAPFWFDLLNRFVNVRSSIRRPQAE
jgi:hypothetical protein